MVGRAPRFGRYVGIPESSVVIHAMLISGSLSGLAGAVSVLGYFGKAIAGMDDGTGFDGLTAAILGGVHPVGAVLVSILFAGIAYGAQGGLQVRFGIPRRDRRRPDRLDHRVRRGRGAAPRYLDRLLGRSGRHARAERTASDSGRR